MLHILTIIISHITITYNCRALSSDINMHNKYNYVYSKSMSKVHLTLSTFFLVWEFHHSVYNNKEYTSFTCLQ